MKKAFTLCIISTSLFCNDTFSFFPEKECELSPLYKEEKKYPEYCEKNFSNVYYQIFILDLKLYEINSRLRQLENK